MHLLVDISGHGLGHLAQVAPVLNALGQQRPALRLSVRSGLTLEQLRRRIEVGFDHIHEARDFGFVMHNAMDIDLAASARCYREFHADWPQRVAIEADWLRRHRVDAVLTNAAYLPLAAAAEAGIPAAGLGSLNWAELFASYFPGEPWAEAIHAQMLDAYNSTAAFLRVTPGLPMADIPHREEIAPVVRRGRRDRDRVARMLDLDTSQRWVLIAMGGMEYPLPLAEWPRRPGLCWLAPAEMAIEREDVRNMDIPGLHFADLLASVDAVLTKPGYGTFVECAYGGIPFIYLQRDDWPETAPFAAWLACHARAQALPREQVLAGDVVDTLQRLWQTPAPPLPPAVGAEQAVQRLVAVLGL